MTAQEGHRDLSLTLTWRHGFGGLAPFFEALGQGRLLGARCPTCGHTTVPPRARCGFDGSCMHPTELPTTGIVTLLTKGAASSLLAAGSEDQTFAEVHVSGSHNRILARIDTDAGLVTVGSQVRLAPFRKPPAHPIQYLVFALAKQETG